MTSASESKISDFGFRISDFEFSIAGKTPQSARTFPRAVNSKLNNRRRQREWFKARPKEEPMNHPLTAVLHRARRARVTQNSKLKTLNPLTS